MAFSPEEVVFCATHAEEIADAAQRVGLTPATAIADADYLKKRFGDCGRSVSELLRARVVGKRKGLSQEWVYPLEAAEQATPPAVTAERQRRIREFFPTQLVHDLTTSIGTEISGSLVGAKEHGGRTIDKAEGGDGRDADKPAHSPFAGTPVIGSDLDLARVMCARYNTGRPVFVADALAHTSAAPVLIADPARRAGGRRIPRPEELLPPLPDLIAAHSGQELAVKCAPGIDYSGWDGLVSVTSVDGGVKEACLYTPGLSGGARREAVIIRGQQLVDRITDSSSAADHADVARDGLVREPGRFIIDPDGAIVRAGLVSQFAVREGLWMLDHRIAHLTGTSIPHGYSGFEVMDQVPLKKLKKALASYRPGALEILVRGVDLNPDLLRKKLKPTGGRPMGIVVTRIGKTASAFICGPRQWALPQSMNTTARIAQHRDR